MKRAQARQQPAAAGRRPRSFKAASIDSAPLLVKKTISRPRGVTATNCSASAAARGLTDAGKNPGACWLKAEATAATTSGWLCPRLSEPKPATKSRYARPDSSNSSAPSPRTKVRVNPVGPPRPIKTGLMCLACRSAACSARPTRSIASPSARSPATPPIAWRASARSA